MRATRTAAVLGSLVLGSALLLGCTDDGDGRSDGCEAVDADFDFASPSREDDERFELDGPGWVGGDSTYSVELPDGRTLWLFSDSFIGEVTSSGHPQPGMVMVHNALVTEDALRHTGRIRLALDVTDPEPLPADHPLWSDPGVIISPHVGGVTEAFRPRMVALLRRQLTALAAGEPAINVVRD